MKSKELIENGVFTLQVLPTENIPEFREEFIRTLAEESPEFLPDAPAYVVGGFGALGNPSSFHHPFFRDLRHRMFQKILPIFRTYSRLYKKEPIWELETEEEYHIQLLMDRASWRRPGTSVANESWHRDNSLPGLIKNGDQIFGMMLNLSEDPINFSCVPGTHSTALAWQAGCFDKISPAEIEEEDYNSRKTIFSLRPGEMIVFFQHIVHEIAKPKGKLKKPEFRLYAGVRLSLGATDFYPKEKLMGWIKAQDVPQIKSGQIPDVYTKMHGVCFKRKPFTVTQGVQLSIEDWLEMTFQFPERISGRVHPSLKSLGLSLHPAYTKEEIRELLPRRLFREG